MGLPEEEEDLERGNTGPLEWKDRPVSQTVRTFPHTIANEFCATKDDSERRTYRTRSVQVGQARRRIRIITEKPKYHYTIITLVIVDLVVAFIDLVLSLLNLSCYSEEQKEIFAHLGEENVP